MMDNTLLHNTRQMYLCTTDKQYRKVLKRLHLPVDQGPYVIHAQGATTHIYPKHIIVCLGDMSNYSKIEVYSLLCHEAVHVFQAAMSALGEGSCGDEIEAYGVQNIFLELASAYNRARSGK